MGTFRKRIEIGNTDGGDSMEVDAAVDTGEAHSMFPASLLTGLRVEPVGNRQFRFADGNAANLDMGLALITIDAEQWPCPVLFSPEETQFLLGATTLEIFDLMVDPVEQQLIPRIHQARMF